METYIALLRGINVSGHKKIKMAALKEMFESMGFNKVTTYIQSGNVVFKSQLTSPHILSKKIKSELLTAFGYEIEVIVFTARDLEAIYTNNPFLKAIAANEKEEKKMYFTFLLNKVDKELEANFTLTYANIEEFEITDKVLYFYVENGYGKTKLSTNFVEKKLKAIASTRNLKTMLKLIEISSID